MVTHHNAFSETETETQTSTHITPQIQFHTPQEASPQPLLILVRLGNIQSEILPQILHALTPTTTLIAPEK
jgi:hypothetical protein